MNHASQNPPDSAVLKEINDVSRKIELGGRVCYEISPYHCYWIDPANRAFKESLAIWAGYIISGNFNPALFLQSLRYLTGRHECLRSSFLSMDGKYYISSEENDCFFEHAFADSLKRDFAHEQDMRDWIYFRGHAFDIENGPLFQVRIGGRGEDRWLVSIKIHHSISDTWSWEVLLRDLLTAYRYFEMGQLPQLPPLRFQYNEWLGWRRHQIEKNYHSQKQYWNALYKGIPDRLLIPGAKVEARNRDLFCREGKKESFLLSGDAVRRLGNLCKAYHVNLFMLLRASFMLYLSKLTGQTDIMIGTMVSGRTPISSHADQIGYYAYTDITRIIFDHCDSLKEAVEKVKKSFKDMYVYSDYILHMALSDMHSPGRVSSAPFWNVNLDFESSYGDPDTASSSQGGSFADIRLERLPGVEAGIVTDMDLKLKIVQKGAGIEIRVLYDRELYDSPAIHSLITGYLAYIEKINDLHG